MASNINLTDFLKAGGKLPKELQKTAPYKAEIDVYAMKIVGLLSDAPNNNVRRKYGDNKEDRRSCSLRRSVGRHPTRDAGGTV